MNQKLFDADLPEPLRRVRHALARLGVRSELELSEIPAPGGLAPAAIAMIGTIRPRGHDDDGESGTGRLVLLHNPDEPEEWGGAYRVVAYAQSPLEPEMGSDPFVSGVAWSWLLDALSSRGAEFGAASGTATKVISTGFGELAHQGDGAQMELRASWTPTDSALENHVAAWAELLCMLAGLPPAEEGVPMISRAHVARG